MATGVEGIAPVDLLVVLVKSYDTRDALAAAAPVVGPDTTILSLQNGLGQEDIIIDLFGRERVIAGKTYAGGVLLGPGPCAGRPQADPYRRARRQRHAAHRGDRGRVQPAPGSKPRSARTSPVTIWDKLLINVATGAWCAVTGAPYGVIYATREIRDCAVAAVAEAMAVAAASGVPVSIRSPEEAWEKAGADLPADFKTSMLQSIEAGRRTEIDFINGAVVRAGEKYGVPTPVNRTLVACVKGIERRLVRDADEL